MKESLLFLLLGLGAGATYALLGLGLILEYRATRVVNFAHGAMAMWFTFVYAELREHGNLLLPVIGAGNHLHIGEPLPTAIALVVTVAYAAVFGALVYFAMVRRMSRVGPLSRLVASVGLMVLLQSIAVLVLGARGIQGQAVPAFLPTTHVTIAGASVSADRLIVAGIAVAATAILSAAFRWTRFGLSTRAVADSSVGAAAIGISATKVGLTNWIAASVLAAIAGILLAPMTRLDVASFTLFIVPALAVALLGRFESFGVVLAGGLTLGVLQSWLTKLQFEVSWLPDAGLPDVVPFVAIAAALLTAGRKIPGRGDAASDRLPSATAGRRPYMTLCGWAATAAVGVIATQGAWRLSVIQSATMAIACLSLVVVAGFAGQVSLAQMTFAGVAAFATSILTKSWGLAFPFAALLASVVAVPFGILVGALSIRARGVQLAVASLAAAVAVDAILFRNPAFTGGVAGRPVAEPTLFGIELGIRGTGPTDFPTAKFGLLTVVVMAATGLVVTALRRSVWGRRMLALRSNERAAAAAGVRITRSKVLAFAVSSWIAGLAGVLMAYQTGFVAGGPFGVFASLALIAVAAVGGISKVSGAMLAGIVLAPGGIGAEAIRHVAGSATYVTVIGGFGLIIAVLFQPDGLSGIVRQRQLKAVTGKRIQRVEPKLPDTTSAPRASEALETRNISVTYGGVRAVIDVSLSVSPGEIVGLIGPNGAGKTTLIDAICGFVNSQGSVTLGGRRLDTDNASARSRAGISRTFQAIELFDDLDVGENLRIATENSGRNQSRREDSGASVGSDLTDEITGIAVGTLPHGSRAQVAVARARAANPVVLILDEPGAGLSPHERESLAAQLRADAAAGRAVLIVDHDMGLVMSVCSRIVVLDAGQVIACGSPEEVRRDPVVLEAYLGSAQPIHEAVVTTP